MLLVNSRLVLRELNTKKKDLILKLKILKREPKMFNYIVLPNKLRKLSKANIKRKMRRIRRDLKTKSNSLKKMLKRELKLSMILNSS